MLNRTMVAMVTLLLSMFSLQSPALAAEQQRSAPSMTVTAAESHTLSAPDVAPGSPTGYVTVDYAAEKLALSVSPQGLATGWCLTTYLDISRASSEGASHYDIRAARSCQANAARASGWQLEGQYHGINITGINKMSICYAPLNVTPTSSQCRHYIGSLSGVNHNFNSNNMCTRAWTKNSSGTNFYFSGGDPKSCTS
jgi:hypothetical protein